MIQLQYIGLLLACIGRTALGGLLTESAGGNGYQYNRPSGGQDFGGSLAGNVFSGTPSSAYGVPSFTSNGSPTSSGGYNNNGSPGFGNRIAGGYAQSGGGYNVGPPGGNFQRSNGPGGFAPGAYQGTGSDGYYQGGGRFNIDDSRPRPYSFQYEVRDPPSGNDYAQQESSDGNSVRGEYRVLLPDSRTQIVKYTADDANGYNADVQYEGQAQFPRGVGSGGAGGLGGYNQFGADGGYQPGGFGTVNNYQGGRGGYSGGLGHGGVFPSVGAVSPAGGVITEPASNGNRYLPPANAGYGK